MRNRGEREARESRLASGWIVEGDPEAKTPAEHEAAEGSTRRASAGDGTAAEGSAAEPSVPEPSTQMSSGTVVMLGVIGGLYLLYTWVWFSWANYYSSVNAAVAEGSGVLGSVMQQITFWAAPFAPILWFLAALVVARPSRPVRLLTWLLIGAVVLVPLPMFEFGAA